MRWGAVSTLEEAVEAEPKADAETLAHYYHDEVLRAWTPYAKPSDALERMGGQGVLAVPDLRGYPVLYLNGQGT